MRKLAARVLAVLALLQFSSFSQTPPTNPQYGEEHPPSPTVTFVLDWPDADPEHYTLVVDSTGRAAYESTSAKRFPTGVPYSARFTVSDGTRDRIFETAHKLNYFQGDFEYKKGKVAFTGKKTLVYGDPTRHFETSYNWSVNQHLRQLTELMQAIATTAEFARTLDYLHRHDRLGLNAELKRIDELATGGQIAELQVLTPQLEQIAGDSNVMEIARQKARRLLDRANVGNTGSNSRAAAQH